MSMRTFEATRLRIRPEERNATPLSISVLNTSKTASAKSCILENETKSCGCESADSCVLEVTRDGSVKPFEKEKEERGRMMISTRPALVCLGRRFSTDLQKHHQLLEKAYEKAPISGLFNTHKISFSSEGDTTVHFTPEKKHCHTAMSLHGSGYFKMLDDAAWFSAQAQVHDNFIYTVSFNTYLQKPVPPGTALVAKGHTTFVSKNMLIAESKLYNGETVVATGSGTFMKAPVALSDLKL